MHIAYPRHVITQVLKDAKENLESGWVKGVLAKNAEGLVVDAEADDACAFCASGAIQRAAPGRELLQYETRKQLKRDTPGLISIVEFNDRDETTQSGVINQFNKTINRLEGRENVD